MYIKCVFKLISEYIKKISCNMYENLFYTNPYAL